VALNTINLNLAVRFLGFEAGGGFSKFQFPLSINLTTITTYTGITDANGVNYLRFMVFNATRNTISVISWQSVLLVEKTGVSRENHRTTTSH
jgi:hypothetical protein